MKNTLLLIALAAFCSLQVCAQSDATEQETVDWLKSKLYNYQWSVIAEGSDLSTYRINSSTLIKDGDVHISFSSDNKQLIIEQRRIREKWECKEGERSFRGVMTLKINIYNINPEGKNYSSMLGSIPNKYIASESGSYAVESRETRESSSKIKELLFSFDEDGLSDRFAKAMRHLAKLKGAKVVKEKF